MTMKNRLPLVADLLMDAAHTDDRLEGEETESIKELLAGILEVPTLPMDLAFRIDEFDAKTFDRAAATKAFAGDAPGAEEAPPRADRGRPRGRRRDRLRRGRSPARGREGAGAAGRELQGAGRRRRRGDRPRRQSQSASLRLRALLPLSAGRGQQKAARNQADGSGRHRREQDAQLGDVDQRPGGNARVVMNRAIVKPMPATRPTTKIPDHRTPEGNAATPARTASHENPSTPTGFPTTRPTTTPISTVAPPPASRASSKLTPAFASANKRHDRERHPAVERALQPLGRRTIFAAGPGADRRAEPDDHAGDRGVNAGGVDTRPDHDARHDVGPRRADRHLLHQQDDEDARRRDAEAADADPRRVKQRDHDDGAEIVDHGEGEQQDPQRRRHALSEKREDPDRERDVGRHRDAPSRRRGRSAVEEQIMPAGATIPPSAAIAGMAALRGDLSVPRNTSSLISSPTTKKKTTIRTSFTRKLTSRPSANPPTWNPSGACRIHS